MSARAAARSACGVGEAPCTCTGVWRTRCDRLAARALGPRQRVRSVRPRGGGIGRREDVASRRSRSRAGARSHRPCAGPTSALGLLCPRGGQDAHGIGSVPAPLSKPQARAPPPHGVGPPRRGRGRRRRARAAPAEVLCPCTGAWRARRPEPPVWGYFRVRGDPIGRVSALRFCRGRPAASGQGRSVSARN